MTNKILIFSIFWFAHIKNLKTHLGLFQHLAYYLSGCNTMRDACSMRLDIIICDSMEDLKGAISTSRYEYKRH